MIYQVRNYTYHEMTLKTFFSRKNITSVISRQNFDYGGSTKHYNSQPETMALDYPKERHTLGIVGR